MQASHAGSRNTTEKLGKTVLIGPETSISFLNLWLLQRYDGGLSWLLIGLANPLLLCRTVFHALGNEDLGKQQCQDTLVTEQHKLRTKGISIPTGTTRHSETIQGSDPARIPPTADVSFCRLDKSYTRFSLLPSALDIPASHSLLLHTSFPCPSSFPIFPLLVCIPSPSIETSLQQLPSCFLRLPSATSPFSSWHHHHSPY